MNIDWIELAKWAGGLAAAAIAGGLVIKSTRSSSHRVQKSKVYQKNNIAGGDIIAGNSVKNHKK